MTESYRQRRNAIARAKTQLRKIYGKDITFFVDYAEEENDGQPNYDNFFLMVDDPEGGFREKWAELYAMKDGSYDFDIKR